MATDPSGSDLWVVDANLPEDTLAFLAEEAATRGRPLAALTVSPAKAVHLLPILDRIDLPLHQPARGGRACSASIRTTRAPPVARLAADLAGHRDDARSSSPTAPSRWRRRPAASSARSRRSAPPSAPSTAPATRFAAGTLRGLASGHALTDSIRFGLARRGDDAGSRQRARRRRSARTRSPSAWAPVAARRRRSNDGLVSAAPLSVSPEVAEALAAGQPVVALETTIVSHGMPWPQNLETALAVEDDGARGRRPPRRHRRHRRRAPRRPRPRDAGAAGAGQRRRSSCPRADLAYGADRRAAPAPPPSPPP